MKKEINVPFILESLKTIGDSFLTDFKKKEIPHDGAGFMKQFSGIEEKCMSFLKERLTKEYPHIPFADGEFDFNEQGKPLDLEEYWICDAMDGAVQYIQHLPGWTINLVLVKHGEPYFAAIYDPLMHELFRAQAGHGAYMNDVPMRVSGKTEPKFMLAIFNHPSSSETIPGLTKKIGASVKSLVDYFGIVRNYGPHGLQLASIGLGRTDVFCQEGLDTYNWLPGILIAKEAGATISTTDGRQWTWGEKSLFVAAPGIVDEFVKQSTANKSV